MADAEAMLKEPVKKKSFRESENFQPIMIGFLSFGCSTFLSVYMMYYMKVFLDFYHISTEWVKISQAAFLIWNAVNDPLMGYMQDIGCCGMTWIMDRRKVLLYVSPVFAFSYLIFWFPWSTTNATITGLHLLFSLFMFDTILTLVFSAYCGILVEACEKHEQRVRCMVYSELFGIIGGSIIFPLNMFSDEARNFERFQIGCVLIAVISAVSMSGGSYFIRAKKEHELHEEIEMVKDAAIVPAKDQSPFKKALKVSWQIVKEPRFICLVCAGFLRMMRMVATDTFMMIIMEAIVSRAGFMETGSTSLSLFYSLVRPIGSITFMLLSKPLSILGTHKTMMIFFTISLVNVTVAFILGRANPLAVVIYIGIESLAASCGGYSFGMLLTGEVVDTDKKVNKRQSPLSTLIFTLKALFTNPAEQLSPLIFISLLDRGGFTLYRSSCVAALATNTTELAVRTESVECSTLFDTMHSSMLYFTLFCTLGELLVISMDFYYKKRILKEIEGEETDEKKMTEDAATPLNP